MLRINLLRSLKMPFFVSLFICSYANASVVNISDNINELDVKVNTETGSIVQLPMPVASISASQDYEIKPVDGHVDAKGALSDVSEFQVTPAKKGKNYSSEKVTFVLQNKKSINFHFIPTKFGEKYYNLQSQSQDRTNSNGDFSGQSQNTIRYDISNFLSSETKMMKAMISDSDSSFKRTVANRDVELSPFKDSIKVKLVRIFQGANLFGYTFVFKNETNKTIHIEPQNLAIGNPNKAIMAQSDRYTLTSCSENKFECVTAVRYIVRDFDESDSEQGLGVSLLNPPMEQMPYIMQTNLNKN